MELMWINTQSYFKTRMELSIKSPKKECPPSLLCDAKISNIVELLHNSFSSQLVIFSHSITLYSLFLFQTCKVSFVVHGGYIGLLFSAPAKAQRLATFETILRHV